MFSSVQSCINAVNSTKQHKKTGASEQDSESSGGRSEQSMHDSNPSLTQATGPKDMGTSEQTDAWPGRKQTCRQTTWEPSDDISKELLLVGSSMHEVTLNR